ncbi:dUTP diphosphatase [Aneurinibacillus terranovensis]|uniref:dUTP diphosphatase n=1 Tax=Aneurinibacillus terranovensis TaxID=278991 RepID=UPI0003F9006F|nr:dUTP diphosphatase [Aneurinibacillus terranovensis]
MNLSKLFEMQRELNAHIIKEKGLEGQDLMPNTILALQAELGELANEWRGFKHWSNDREPRTFKRDSCPDCAKRGFSRYNPPKEENYWCETCAGYLVIDKNPLLEEYVDCLHFILSIGLQVGVSTDIDVTPCPPNKDIRSITIRFIKLMKNADSVIEHDNKELAWSIYAGSFIGLGAELGFTWEQIEQAYFEKNKVNHTRQESGY